MSERLFIKPADGLIIRDPVSYQVLPPEGKKVKPSLFWRRRLKEGAVYEAQEPKPPSKPKNKTNSAGDEA